MKPVKAFVLCSVFMAAVLAVHIFLSFTKPPKQERRFSISLTGPDIDIVLEGLGKLPLEKSGELFLNIQRQAQMQLQPQQKPLPKADTTTKPKKQ